MTITDALVSLLPGVEWTLLGDDLSTLEIHTEGIKAPTKLQVDKEIARLVSVKEAEDAQRAAQKVALLQRLGITAEEASLLSA
jgi:hypothetical protein